MERLQLHSLQPPSPRRELGSPWTVLKIWPADGSGTFFGYASNISRGGIRIDATSPRESESRHRLEMPLPTGTAQCHCEVVWKRGYACGEANPPAMGLRFLDLPAEVSEALDEWVRRVPALRL